MAVHENGIRVQSFGYFTPDVELEVGKLFRTYGLKRDIGKREIEFLLRMNNYYAYQPNVNASIKSKDSYLFHQIKSSPNLKENCIYYIQAIENRLVDINQFESLKDNSHRKILFLCHFLFAPNPLHFFTSNLFENFIYNLDNLTNDISWKINALNQALLNYENLKLPIKEIKWIDKNNQTQIDWGLDYLIKSQNIFINNHHNVSNQDKYESILASLDTLAYQSKEFKELFLLKMKKTWSQKKFRDSGKAKKLYHLPLSEATKQKLEKIAEFNHTNKAAILERLINYEFENTNF